MPLRRRIITGYGLLGALVALGALFQLWSFHSVQREIDDISRTRFSVEKRIRYCREIIWRIDSEVLTALYFNVVQPEARLANLDEQAAEFYSSIESVRSELGLESGDVRDLFNSFQAYYLFGKRMLGKIGSGGVLQENVAVFHDIRGQLVHEVQKAYARHVEDFDMQVRGARQLARRLTWLSWGTVGVVCIAAALIGLSTMRSVLSPLRRLNRAVRDISEGNFKVCVDENDSGELGNLGRAINEMSTALEAHQRELEESEHRFRSLFQNVTNGFFRCRMDGMPVLINPAMAHILGYDNVDEVMGRPFGSEHDFVDPEQFRELQRRMIEHRQVRDYRVQFRRCDGSIITAMAEYNVVLDEHDGQEYVEGVVIDITDRVRAEKLEQARREAEEANRAKSRFLANMSHEIRSPMNVVLAMAELLGEGELSPRQKHYLEVLQRSGNTLLEIINAVLDLSKIESGRIELENVAFSVPEFMAGVRDLAAPRARRGNLSLKIVQVGPQPEQLLGDPTRLHQVFANLLDNAFKFTREGGVTVTFDWRGEGEDVELRAVVADTGAGISLERQQAVFESFTQEDSSTTRNYGGTGLGLTIARQLVELMNGRMSVKSEPQVGTSFECVIPFRVKTPQRTLQPLKDVRVLFFDPDLHAERTVAENVMACGAEVTLAPLPSSVGDLAAEAGVRGRPFSAMLVRGEEWREAVDALQRSGHPEIPVLAMLSPEDYPGADHPAGALLDAVLADPPLRHEVRDALDAVLAGGSPGKLGASSARVAQLKSAVDVLLVEDSEFNRTVVSSFLKDLPVNLHIARNGREGVDIFRTDTFDLIIMDMLMPIMDGYQATREIRRLEELNGTRPVPVLALTANAFKEDRDRSLAAGCTDYMAKPVRKANLVEAVVRLVQTGSEVSS